MSAQEMPSSHSPTQKQHSGLFKSSSQGQSQVRPHRWKASQVLLELSHSIPRRTHSLLSWMGWEITGFRGKEKEPSLARRKAVKRSRTMLRSITFFSSLASCSSSRRSASGWTAPCELWAPVPCSFPSTALTSPCYHTCKALRLGAEPLSLQFLNHNLHHVFLGDMQDTQVVKSGEEEEKSEGFVSPRNLTALSS